MDNDRELTQVEIALDREDGSASGSFPESKSESKSESDSESDINSSLELTKFNLLEQLPTDILPLIFAYFDERTLQSFTCVCHFRLTADQIAAWATTDLPPSTLIWRTFFFQMGNRILV